MEGIDKRTIRDLIGCEVAFVHGLAKHTKQYEISTKQLTIWVVSKVSSSGCP